MAHKTFISYKYSEARGLRDKIIAKLGSDAQYYMGEDGYSDDLSSYTATTIKRRLANMIYGTSVTIVILSPNMSRSRWIPWEIEYSLTEYSRSERTSRTNGIVCVVQKQPNPYATSAYSISTGYDWLKNYNRYHSAISAQSQWDESKLFSIIKSNRNNRISWQLNNWLSPHYIDIVTEDDFLRDPSKYIEGAYIKSQNVDSYNITKQVGGGYY